MKLVQILKNNIFGVALAGLIVALSVSLLVKGPDAGGEIPDDIVAVEVEEDSFDESRSLGDVTPQTTGPETPNNDAFDTGFRDIEWGMSRAEVQESEGAPFDADSLWTATYFENQTVFGFDASSVTFIFNAKDELYEVQCTVDIRDSDKAGYDADYDLLRDRISEIYGAPSVHRESARWGDELRQSEVDPYEWFEEMNLFKRKQPGDLSYYTAWSAGIGYIYLIMAGSPTAEPNDQISTYLVLGTSSQEFWEFDSIVDERNGLSELSDPEQFSNIDYYLSKFQGKEDMVLDYPEYEANIKWYEHSLFGFYEFGMWAVSSKDDTGTSVFKKPSTSATIIDVITGGEAICEYYLEGGRIYEGYYFVVSEGKTWMAISFYDDDRKRVTGWVMEDDVE